MIRRTLTAPSRSLYTRTGPSSARADVTACRAPFTGLEAHMPATPPAAARVTAAHGVGEQGAALVSDSVEHSDPQRSATWHSR